MSRRVRRAERAATAGGLARWAYRVALLSVKTHTLISPAALTQEKQALPEPEAREEQGHVNERKDYPSMEDQPYRVDGWMSMFLGLMQGVTDEEDAHA
ncbi:MAG: hypothetical protein E6I91_09675 [Chloroflexi bacterium]|nr:MAG: hypothetical protein E6I91_09675 [Chloroflexota bacterium]